MSEISDRKQMRIICNSIRTITELCPYPEEKVVNLLTGYLWDEQEAGKLKEMLNDSPDSSPVDELMEESKERVENAKKT